MCNGVSSGSLERICSLATGAQSLGCCERDVAYMRFLAECVRAGGKSEIEWCRRACDEVVSRCVGGSGLLGGEPGTAWESRSGVDGSSSCNGRHDGVVASCGGCGASVRSETGGSSCESGSRSDFDGGSKLGAQLGDGNGECVAESSVVDHNRRGPNWARNRAWKAKRKSAAVPEWRRKAPVAMVHKGVFAECSEEVRVELRESRAKMLVAKNEVALVEAEHRRRTVEARLKARLVEEEVERKRLELIEVNQKLVAAQMARHPAGFAETVVSYGLESLVSSPSLSSGSVSPDSSVSVAELKKREVALVKMIERVAELEAEVASSKSGQTKKNTESPSVSLGCEEVNGSQPFGKRWMLNVERESRKMRGLPVTGPGSGMDGYGKWD